MASPTHPISYVLPIVTGPENGSSKALALTVAVEIARRESRLESFILSRLKPV